MPSLKTFMPLARNLVRVPLRRAFGPKDAHAPQWTTRFDILVTTLRDTFQATAHLSTSERRAVFDDLRTPSPLVMKLRREDVNANGVPATWFLPPRAEAAPVLLFLHGGAYQFGSVKTYTDVICRLALEANVRVLAVDYRLAPEHPFPAPLEDATRAYEYLRARAHPVVVAGDSAGGNLAVSLAISLRDRGEVLPQGLALICPWVDLGDGGPSREINAPFDTLPEGIGDIWAVTYAAGHPLRDPRISPLFADLRGLPPMLIHAGGREIIRDDIRAFAERAREAGNAVTFTEYAEMVHDWHMFASFGIPESLRAMTEVARFVADAPRAASQAHSNASQPTQDKAHATKREHHETAENA